MMDRTEYAIACAREDVAFGVKHNAETHLHVARGHVHCLLALGAIDSIRFWSLCNEFHFLFDRARERRAEGLPC